MPKVGGVCAACVCGGCAGVGCRHYWWESLDKGTAAEERVEREREFSTRLAPKHVGRRVSEKGRSAMREERKRRGVDASE